MKSKDIPIPNCGQVVLYPTICQNLTEKDVIYP